MSQKLALKITAQRISKNIIYTTFCFYKMNRLLRYFLLLLLPIPVVGQINISFGSIMEVRNVYEFAMALSTFMKQEDLDSLLNSQYSFVVSLDVDFHGNPRNVTIRKDVGKRGVKDGFDYYPEIFNQTVFIEHIKSGGYVFSPVYKGGETNSRFTEVGRILQTSFMPYNTVVFDFPGFLRGKKISSNCWPPNIHSALDFIRLKNPFLVFTPYRLRPPEKETNKLFYTDEFYNSMVLYCALLHFCGSFVVDDLMHTLSPGEEKVIMNVIIDSEGLPVEIESLTWEGQRDTKYIESKILDFFKLYHVVFKSGQKKGEKTVKVTFPGLITEVIAEKIGTDWETASISADFNHYCSMFCRGLYYKEYNLDPYK